ncbi:hypothetical protein ScPMuIL_010651 [Solemya velum]
MYALFIVTLVLAPEYTFGAATEPKYHALVNITYRDHEDVLQSTVRQMGFFALDGRREAETGVLVHVKSEYNNSRDACSRIQQPHVTTKWIALVKRGACDFTKKVHNTAKKSNASAVVIYNNVAPREDSAQSEDVGITGRVYREDDVVTIFISKKDGDFITDLVDDGLTVTMHIRVGTVQPPSSKDVTHHNAHNISKTSVLFVSISFIVLMIISLAWLVFYYIQRFRYAHAKERLSRRLASAAKKAIAKIPQRTLRSGDKELESETDQCPVCIEPYKTSEVIRILPCKHVFHKSCVDPWLLDQRSCPMCKLDILRAYGMHLNGSQDSVHPDPESTIVAASAITEDAERSPTPEDSGPIRVKINIYERPAVHFRNLSSGECSQEAEHLNTCNEITTQSAISLDSVLSSDSECNEWHSLMTGMPLQNEERESPSI